MTGGTSHTLAELAKRLAGEVVGDGEALITGVAPLDTAGPGEISFLSNRKYLPQARATRASAVLMGPGAELEGVNLLVVANPYLALAELIEIYHPRTRPAAGISPAAIVGANVRIDNGATVMAGAVIGERCQVGRQVVIMSGAVRCPDVSVGEQTVIHPNVTVYDGCVIGNRVIIHAGTVIGSDGFGFARDGVRHRKIPQVGNVVIEDDVEIGANVAVDRGTFGSTLIGRGTKIDNLVQIAHNVLIGENTLLVAQSGISGSTRLGNGVTFAGQSGAVGHIEIGDGAIVGAKSAVTHDLPAGAFVIGHPAIDARLWKRAAALFARLPELRRRLMRLEGAQDTDDKEA